MSAMLDLFFAATVAVMLILNVMHVNDDLLTMRHRNTLQYALQANHADLQGMLLRDLRMAGHGADPGSGITRAYSTLLEFRGDVLRDGAQHTVRYTVGNTAEAAMTAHPRDVILWRTVDGVDAQAYAFGLVDLRFTYLDSTGEVTIDSSKVRRVCYEYVLESPTPYGDDPPAVWVTGGVSPKNLQ
ncbi:MAG: hypothetical protein HN712_03730 [Gemmatimonadetes bacterium]|jgi:hypothetical protein|nr:hypothetical protein [Gemmatimonadota bacterium]MBT6144384.1 hypothetical protein [Gemmatimonadota bacterium]MBT7859391.1 hypothetical protein [Gemmatimonadota bacterium]